MRTLYYIKYLLRYRYKHKMDTKKCHRCQATWIEGVHYWSTGKKGDPEKLSNLVCGMVEDPKCTNPSHIKGHIYGDKDTWEKRSKFVKLKLKEIDDA